MNANGAPRGLLGRAAWRYAAAGALFGAGSPLGLYVIRVLRAFHDHAFRWTAEEFGRLGWVYLYMAVGTIVAFSLLGYWAGAWNDRLARRAEDFESIGLRDEVTGVYVRRYLFERFREEMGRAARYKHALSCLFIDVDGFKGLNDRHGHPFGDLTLARVAGVARACIRDSDLLGRYGGDEFLVILPQVTAERAFAAAERIRRGVEALALEADNKRVPVTVSIGVAAAEPGHMALAEFLEKLDKALHESKARGKNTVFIERPAAEAVRP